ncbi:TOBE domain-containing protein [Aquimarina sp. 2201CG14-23]|uniref:TOBE domain-containing protein n=1 Tax=Aquimarina mycalae TaxID=3040073 RepID=UPI002477F8C9|nr:TOBE domain-containing protein [Aquimarina sp. 2201CG14-23]MDH7447776.1 tobe domain protein [Aquimarina sp. 2201CG14-23]
MNIFSGHISEIEVNGSLSMVSVQINKHIELKTIVVETPDTAAYLRKGNSVDILFKETEVIIAKQDNLLISIQNKIEGTIQEIEKGMLLSKLMVSTQIGEVIAILSTEAVDRLLLIEDEKVCVMIQTNEIMISG